MVELAWNMQGYVFQEGIAVLIAAHQSAADALHEEWERAKENAIAYQQGVESGETEWVGERDDEGYVIWDQDQVHEMEIESKREAQAALRKAFALSIYHHWERSARRWTGSDKRDHDQLVKAVRDKGIPISPRLSAVRDLVNLLKHDNDKRGEELLESWSALFSPKFKKSVARTDWYDAVQLTGDHLDEAFNIVSNSGPNINTARK